MEAVNHWPLKGIGGSPFPPLWGTSMIKNISYKKYFICEWYKDIKTFEKYYTGGRLLRLKFIS